MDKLTHLLPIKHRQLYDWIHRRKPSYGHSDLRLGIIEPYIRRTTFDSVLDVGCGQGQVIRWLMEKYHPNRIMGVEISGAALAKAKDLSSLGCLVQGKAQDIPFSDNSFDLVVCTDVLEHIPEEDVGKCLSEIVRVSRHDVLLEVHTSWAIEDLALRHSPWRGRSLHETQKKKRWWKEMITSAGLEILDSTPDREGQQSFVFQCICNPSGSVA